MKFKCVSKRVHDGMHITEFKTELVHLHKDSNFTGQVHFTLSLTEEAAVKFDVDTVYEATFAPVAK